MLTLLLFACRSQPPPMPPPTFMLQASDHTAVFMEALLDKLGLQNEPPPTRSRNTMEAEDPNAKRESTLIR